MKTQTAKRLHWLVTAPLLIGAVMLGYTNQAKSEPTYDYITLEVYKYMPPGCNPCDGWIQTDFQVSSGGKNTKFKTVGNMPQHVYRGPRDPLTMSVAGYPCLYNGSPIVWADIGADIAAAYNPEIHRCTIDKNPKLSTVFPGKLSINFKSSDGKTPLAAAQALEMQYKGQLAPGKATFTFEKQQKPIVTGTWAGNRRYMGMMIDSKGYATASQNEIYCTYQGKRMWTVSNNTKSITAEFSYQNVKGTPIVNKCTISGQGITAGQ